MSADWDARSVHERDAPNERTLLAALECLLLVGGGPVSLERLAETIERTPEQTADLLARLRRDYEGRGLMIQAVAGGYQLCTRPEYADFVGRLVAAQAEPLTRATLETLAIVAYKQPVTRAEIEAVRGARSDHHLRKLADRNLIREVGRRPGPRSPILYGTTELFLRHFGLRALSDLPPVGSEQHLKEMLGDPSEAMRSG
ncbi:MAG: SMC-Scp complex subunit ScpB [Armatimonadota bacterium]|nr:SMC-Scp complex subunit ScpB [Armatimonadota bacterium]MDR5697216.1 SMC-Scp complex subunit ScpB [Armatimonadota bacterium]